MTLLFRPLIHYVAIGALLVLCYFLGDALLGRLHGPAQHPVATSTPATAATTALTTATAALKDVAIADALSGKALQLSTSQQTISSAITRTTGITSQLASALTEGLTRPSPKAQVITVGVKANSTPVFPPIVSSDDEIERDLKTVLATTTINTHVDTTVHVSWEDKPFSPIFAVYATGNASGLGYTLHTARALSLDALVLQTPTSANKGIAAGLGLEHVFKGTSAGLGVDAAYNFGAHRPGAGVYVAIHF